MDVEAGAGDVGERLGHEGGVAAERPGDALDGALEQYGVVGGAQRIGAVVQRQLHLARRRFLAGAFQRNPLRVGRLPQGAEDIGGILGLQQPVRLATERGAPRETRTAQADLSVDGLDQIEFQLARHDRRQTIGREPLQHAGQHRARIEDGRGAIKLVERAHHLRGVRAEPRRRHHPARHGARDAIGVAGLPDHAGILAILPEDIDRDDRARQESRAFIQLHHLGSAHPLAARHTAQRSEEHLEIVDAGMRIEKTQRLARVRRKRVGQRDAFSGA